MRRRLMALRREVGHDAATVRPARFFRMSIERRGRYGVLYRLLTLRLDVVSRRGSSACRTIEASRRRSREQAAQGEGGEEGARSRRARTRRRRRPRSRRSPTGRYQFCTPSSLARTVSAVSRGSTSSSSPASMPDRISFSTPSLRAWRSAQYSVKVSGSWAESAVDLVDVVREGAQGLGVEADEPEEPHRRRSALGVDPGEEGERHPVHRGHDLARGSPPCCGSSSRSTTAGGRRPRRSRSCVVAATPWWANRRLATATISSRGSWAVWPGRGRRGRPVLGLPASWPRRGRHGGDPTDVCERCVNDGPRSLTGRAAVPHSGRGFDSPSNRRGRPPTVPNPRTWWTPPPRGPPGPTPGPRPARQRRRPCAPCPPPAAVDLPAGVEPDDVVWDETLGVGRLRLPGPGARHPSAPRATSTATPACSVLVYNADAARRAPERRRHRARCSGTPTSGRGRAAALRHGPGAARRSSGDQRHHDALCGSRPREQRRPSATGRCTARRPAAATGSSWR